MDIGIWLVFFAVFLISLLALRKRPNLPPSRFTIPYIGTLGFLWRIKGRRPHEFFVEEAKKLGSVFSFSVGNKLIVVLNGYDAVHEALVKNADTCSCRADVLRKMLKVGTRHDGIITCAYGKNLKDSRRFTLQALRDFGVGKTSIEEKIVTEVDALTAVLKDTNGKPTTFCRPIQKLVGNVIFGIVFGKRYEFDDPEFDNVLQLTNDLTDNELFVSPELFLPDACVNLIKRWSSVTADTIKLAEKTHTVIDKLIEEHEKTFDNDNIRDFVDFYLRTVKYGNEYSGKHLTRENLFQIIVDLFLAGSETTSTSLDWAMLFMTEYPDVQKKCQEELEKVIGDRAVTYADRNNLPYIQSTIMEIQRKQILAPLAVPHFTTQNTKICGFDIPKDTFLLANLHSTSIDPKYWQDPEKFYPGRFMNEDGTLKKVDQLVPFSVGPRTCLGEPLARMELFLVFSNLLQRFTFSKESEHVKNSLESVIGKVTSQPHPYKLRAYYRA